MILKKTLLCILLFLTATDFVLGQKHDAQSEANNFFPIAVWAQDPLNAAAYKSNGINMFINIYGGLDDEKLSRLRDAGMKVIAYQNEFGLTRLDEPLIYGWMHHDGPDNAQPTKDKNKWDPCHDPDMIIRDYERIKKNDPRRPVYLNVGPGVAHTNWVGRGICRGRTDMYKVANNGYLKGCDIASFDIYPVNSSEPEIEGQLWYVARGIDNLRAWSGDTKPAWCWIETTQISEKSGRRPTPSEVKSQVWMALVHGAKGFGYFCHSFVGKTEDAALLKDAEMLRSVKAINSEVTALAHILNSPETTGYAKAKSSNPEIPVDITTRKDKRTSYIFAVAMRKGQTTATFDVKSGRTVEVIGENRSIRIRKRRFTDDFSSYGVHLYRITR